ncbi:H-NS histone family protein [Luteibacter anthropi]|uniref:H-NS histone family protein n=1 Tax=Luteibacter anthropi TaxID=564369 RepID=A0A7X5ZJG1_9GAMM|nr:H-NS histone family protein [Luteibacter anthropi]NII07715.1 H-NS histone family protein [Luteibacter anthropi]URX61012.1 H-NS histone family protein [Luteibacter anthropi]
MAVDIKNLNHNQLTDLIAKAQARQGELSKERTSKVREQIQAILKKEGVTLDDVFPSRGGAKSKRAGTTVAAKFRDPANPENTWSGRGKRPRWFNDALKAGKKEKDLLIG